MSAKYLYQLPQLKGNSAAIKKINKSLRADYKRTFGNKRSLFEYFEMDKHNPSRKSYGSKYYATVTCEPVYNRKGYQARRLWYALDLTSQWEEIILSLLQ